MPAFFRKNGKAFKLLCLCKIGLFHTINKFFCRLSKTNAFQNNPQTYLPFREND